MDYKNAFKDELVLTLELYWTQNRLGFNHSNLTRTFGKRATSHALSLNMLLIELCNENRLKLIFTRQDGRWYYPMNVWDTLSETEKLTQVNLIRKPKDIRSLKNWQDRPVDMPIPRNLTADEIDALPDDESA